MHGNEVRIDETDVKVEDRKYNGSVTRLLFQIFLSVLFPSRTLARQKWVQYTSCKFID